VASLRYQPSLDGLRAVALGAVLVVHGLPSVLPGGFLGVDLFFVLSGFLITSLLLAEVEAAGRADLGAFWLRRARRLLPALVLVVAVTVGTARWLLPAQDPAALRADGVAALTYWANWRMILRGGGDYFTRTADASPLQHTWSLAIEEQFYLLWPLLLLLALRAARPRVAIAAVSLAGAAASAVAAALLYDPARTDRVYFGTDTRAGALLVGCALAAALPALSRRPRGVQAAGLAGAITFAACCRFATGHQPWLLRGGLLVPAVAAAAVLASLSMAPRSTVARILSASPLTAVGKISYGGYLWHWPLFAVLDSARTGLHGLPLFALRAAATLSAAALSFALLERPIRRGIRPRIPLAALSAAAVAAIALALLPLAKPDVVPPVLPAAFQPSAASSSAPAVAPTARPERRPGPPRVMVIGDSVAWTLGAYWPGDPRFDLANEAVQGCGIAALPDLRYAGDLHEPFPYCSTWQQRWSSSADRTDPDLVVVLLDRWELMDRRLGGRWTNVGQPDYDAYLGGQLRAALDAVSGHGARPVLLTAPYTHRAERPDGGLWPEDDPARVNAWNRLLSSVASTHPSHPAVLDLNRLLCPAGAFTWTVAGVRVRSDGLHLTPEGVREVVAPWLSAQLASLARGS